MTNQESVDWPGAALVARLPEFRRRRERRQPGRGKATLLRISRLTALSRFLQDRINEVARVLRMPPPRFRIDHLGRTTLDDLPVQLDLRQIEALRGSPFPRVCSLTLLRAFLAGLFAPLLKGEWLRRLLPSAAECLTSMTDFLAGYVLAAFRATCETRKAFLQQIAPLPDKQNPSYQDRLFAFEQGQLAFLAPAT
ncbi:MAG: hypothetical protein RMJ98_02145 [Myxococcales bacterium]|nr:hypothetical protein [Polyangiaceae bacterium]MDW8248090.1 hypothetical protein [Myxococcales bacterium]